MALTPLVHWLYGKPRHPRRSARGGPNGRRRHLSLEQLEERLAPDAAGLRVVSITPQEVRNATLDHIDVRFNVAVDPASFSIEDVKIAGPSGAVAATGVE